MKENKPIRYNNSLIILVIGLLNGLMPFATDLYLPAFSQIGQELNTSTGSIALTMSSFFVGSCIGQLVNGPILDKYGRKYPMIAGLVLFLVASIICGVSQFIELLVVSRFFQAIGLSMCNVGGKAVVRDIFPPSETARIFSLVGLIMGIAPIIAPTVGSGLLIGFGWRSIFYSLAIFSAIIILLLQLFLPNTVKKDDSYSLSLKNILGRYVLVIRNRKFFIYSLITGMSSAVLFSWISSSSFVFIELLDLSELQFGMIFASTATCMLFSNQVNIFLLKRFSSEDIALGAVIAQIALSVLVLFIVEYQFTWSFMLVGMCLLMFFLPMITTNAMSLGLNEITENLGVANAFMGSLRTALCAIVTFLLSIFLLDTAFPMPLAILTISIVSFILQLSVKKAWV